ncbi:dihydrofolate reductase [Herbidospora sp. NEAU-GS84]|uniref:Dihydrofolate reductase n=1 Tax=Herbidospora solisilvae TaxID=2696284 RepID=A0A7C9N4S0_9ACTN|nr:dihydrofolate reductase family protein [Herbidospora solisilvae]NAS24474.1 dihydrofolate reductase [Herbidospora solisilvae]
MRELTYYVAVSLDGRISGPADDFSAFPVEGDHIEMIKRDYRDTLSDVGLRMLGLTADGSRFDTTLMGWNTYAAGFAHTRDPYPHTRQYVFSRTRGPADVADGIALTGEDPVEVVRRLKKEEGTGIWLCGGGLLAGALADEIDRMVLKVNPVVLQDGPPLFAAPYAPRAFRLERSTPYASGVVVNEYVHA